MKRFNFDTSPVTAGGFGVHASTKSQAWRRVYLLAKDSGYYGKLQFRDNDKCPKRNTLDKNLECCICHNNSPFLVRKLREKKNREK